MAISMKLKDAVTNLSKGSVLSHPLSSEYHSKSLLDSYNDYVFLWNEYDSSVVAVSQRDHEFEKVHLVPTDTPFFQVNQLSVSPSGKWIIISGKKGKNKKGKTVSLNDFLSKGSANGGPDTTTVVMPSASW